MEHIRAQLIAFTEFALQTPDPNPHHDMLWWTGDLPATPDIYPLDAEHMRKLCAAVMGYLGRLVHAARKHAWAKGYLDKLMQQEYADLYAYLDIAPIELW